LSAVPRRHQLSKAAAYSSQIEAACMHIKEEVREDGYMQAGIGLRVGAILLHACMSV
jgi:hypothetical protein